MFIWLWFPLYPQLINASICGAPNQPCPFRLQLCCSKRQQLVWRVRVPDVAEMWENRAIFTWLRLTALEVYPGCCGQRALPERRVGCSRGSACFLWALTRLCANRAFRQRKHSKPNVAAGAEPATDAHVPHATIIFQAMQSSHLLALQNAPRFRLTTATSWYLYLCSSLAQTEFSAHFMFSRRPLKTLYWW